MPRFSQGKPSKKKIAEALRFPAPPAKPFVIPGCISLEPLPAATAPVAAANPDAAIDEANSLANDWSLEADIAQWADAAAANADDDDAVPFPALSAQFRMPATQAAAPSATGKEAPSLEEFVATKIHPALSGAIKELLIGNYVRMKTFPAAKIV